jgi:hypothetical protein
MIEKKQQEILRKCDDRVLSPSDFTLIISGLPPDDYTAEEIEDLVVTRLERIYQKKGLLNHNKVEKIVTSHDIRLKVKEFEKFNRMQSIEKKQKVKVQNEKVKKQKSLKLHRIASDGAQSPPDHDSHSLRIPIESETYKPGRQKSPELPRNANVKIFNHRISLECQGSPLHRLGKKGSLPSVPELEEISYKKKLAFKPSGVVFVTLTKQDGKIYLIYIFICLNLIFFLNFFFPLSRS